MAVQAINSTTVAPGVVTISQLISPGLVLDWTLQRVTGVTGFASPHVRLFDMTSYDLSAAARLVSRREGDGAR